MGITTYLNRALDFCKNFMLPFLDVKLTIWMAAIPNFRYVRDVLRRFGFVDTFRIPNLHFTFKVTLFAKSIYQTCSVSRNVNAYNGDRKPYMPVS